MRRATVGPGAKENAFFPSARAPSAVPARGRNGGLFSSSSSSSGDSDGSENENDGRQRVGAVPPLLGATARSRSANLNGNSTDFRRRTMFSTSTTSLGASAGVGDNGGHSGERKGLFENDDDAGDSLETFHERVKLRQSRKQSELKALRAQLETTQQRVEELETKLVETEKEKDEFAIRTKECQRIIEKRNKQLMKASEKMARHSEQFELQTAEMQTKVAALTTQCDQLRADAAASEELGRRERELREQEMQREAETRSKKHEKLLQAAEMKLREQQAENAALARKVKETEQLLASAAHQKPTTAQVTASDEYQSLLKRCEDAEAISRGLNFQLEKEQQEKKYLRKQLTALQATVGASTAATTAASVGFFPDSLMSEAKEGSANPRDSVVTISGDADLASFDFTAEKGSTPSSPVVAAAPSAELSSPTSGASSPSRSRSRSRGFSASSFTDEAPKTSLREGKRRAASAQTLKTSFEPPEKSAEEKTTTVNGKSVGTSVTFFEKLSSRFKRGSTSPRNGLNISKPDEEDGDGVSIGETGFASPLPPRQAFAHSKVLKERPRMYVAKSPSHHEDESSDSIFGSDSSSSDSSGNDEIPPPPPPPPITVHEAPAPFATASPLHMDIPSQLIPSDASADADSSSLSESDDDDDEKLDRHEEYDKPTRLPTRFADPLESRGPSVNHGVSQPLSGISSSSSSSTSSDDDADEPDVEKSHPLSVDAKKVESLSESSSSESSLSSDDEKVVGEIKTKVHQKVRKASLSSLDRHGKSSSRSPTSPKTREKKRSLSGGDNAHSTSKSRMNEYMEARARKRNEKLKRKQDKEHEETKKKEEYEKEWEKMAQEERERKRKQQQARRNGRRRPASMKTVRVSQMRQQMNSKQQQKEPQVSPPPQPNDALRPQGDGNADPVSQPRHSRRKSESKTSESEEEIERPSVFRSPSVETPPLPPEPTVADTELYIRQQARLRERHELQMKKKLEADEADLVRGDIHRRVEMWSFGKELLHMILTLDQISSNDALKKCQLMVVQSPDDDTVRKAYRNIIRVVHPDKLRGATIPEQLEAKELFTVLNQAFEKFKNQTS